MPLLGPESEISLEDKRKYPLSSDAQFFGGSVPPTHLSKTSSILICVSGWHCACGYRSAESWKASPAMARQRICRPWEHHQPAVYLRNPGDHPTLLDIVEVSANESPAMDT